MLSASRESRDSLRHARLARLLHNSRSAILEFLLETARSIYIAIYCVVCVCVYRYQSTARALRNDLRSHCQSTRGRNCAHEKKFNFSRSFCGYRAADPLAPRCFTQYPLYALLPRYLLRYLQSFMDVVSFSYFFSPI